MLSALLLAATIVPISEGEPPILDPKVYDSPRAKCSLEVDPSSPSGAGPGRYVLRRGAEVVWRGEKPWTFWEATVTDDGYAAGYAYTAGYRDYRVEGEFHAVIFAPDGSCLLDRKVPRTSSRFMHEAPDPLGTGVLYHPELDRVVFRVRDPDINRCSEEWWCFQLPSGKELWRKQPKESLKDIEDTRFVLAAQPLLGTPLTLVEWWRPDFSTRPTQLGVRLALLDRDLDLVWEETRPRDCTFADEAAANQARKKVWDGGTLLPSPGPRRFAIAAPASSEQVVYEATRGSTDGAWTVHAIAKTPHAFISPGPPAMPTMQPKLLAQVDLSGPERADQSPIRDIQAFAFTSAGALRVVRKEQQPRSFTLLTVDTDGRLIADQAVTIPDHDPQEYVHWWPVREEAWLATEVPDGSEKGRSWIVAEGSGIAQSFDAVQCSLFHEVEGTPAGGVVTLTHEGEMSTTHYLTSYDSEGRRRWRLASNTTLEKESLFSPEDIAVTPEGKIVVVDTIRHALQTFRADGGFESSCDLDAAWGREAKYPCGVTRDVDGGVLVQDSADGPLVRMHASGVVRVTLTPTFVDGRRSSDLCRHTQVAPDGNLWTHDGERLLRLDEKGVVNRVLGSKPKSEELAEPSAAAIDVLGRVLIQDKATACIHVFGFDGKRLFVCRAETGDFAKISSIAHLASSRDGGVIVEAQSGRHVVFDGRGSRIEATKSLPASPVYSPASHLLCGMDGSFTSGSGMAILDENLVKVASIDRMPDRSWLRACEHAVGPEGTIAILNAPRMMSLDPAAHVLALYSPRGEPLRQIVIQGDVPAMRLALGAKWAALSSFGPEVVLVRLADGMAFRLTIPGPATARSWRYGFSADGQELLALDPTNLRLLRFEVPQ